MIVAKPCCINVEWRSIAWRRYIQTSGRCVMNSTTRFWLSTVTIASIAESTISASRLLLRDSLVFARAFVGMRLFLGCTRLSALRKGYGSQEPLLSSSFGDLQKMSQGNNAGFTRCYFTDSEGNILARFSRGSGRIDEVRFPADSHWR